MFLFEIPLNLPRTNKPRTKDTAILSRGIREWQDENRDEIETIEDFETHPWPDLEEVADLTYFELLERFQRALINNFLWIMGVIFVPIFFGLILAYILLDVKGKRIFTAALWIPYAISPVALGYIFYFVFDPKIGLINSTLEILGLGFLKRAWLSSWPLNTFSLIIGSWWNRFAFSTIVYLAGMTTISRDIIDAAKLDGGSYLGIYGRIMLPLSVPALTVAFLFQFIWIWNDMIFGLVLTANLSTRPLMTQLAMLKGGYITSFGAMAVGSIISIFIPIVVILVFRKNSSKGLEHLCKIRRFKTIEF